MPKPSPVRKMIKLTKVKKRQDTDFVKNFAPLGVHVFERGDIELGYTLGKGTYGIVHVADIRLPTGESSS